jgi:hypothetical protein
MEAKLRNNWSGLRKTAIFLMFFGLFAAVQAEAGLLAPSLSVSPSITNVSKGDTFVINVQSSVTIGVLSSISCQFSGGAFPANASFTTAGGGSLLVLGGTVDAILTITNVTAANAGTYTFSASTVGLLGIGLLTSTAPCTVTVTPTIVGIAANSQMQQKGFKVQFSGPTGSNLVIQASSDMQHWTDVYTNVVTAGTVTFTDAVAKTVSGRYYRAKLQ